MKSPLERFQSLLRKLFQFDCQDLDFGIYRVLNFKRREIEDFITNRLPKRVDDAFARYAAAERATGGPNNNLTGTHCFEPITIKKGSLDGSIG